MKLRTFLKKHKAYLSAIIGVFIHSLFVEAHFQEQTNKDKALKLVLDVLA